MKHLKRKLMMTLALLLTAVTGAWATDYTTLAVGDVIKVGDKFSPTAESEGAFNDFGVDNGKIYKLIRADVGNGVTEKTDGAYYVFKFVSDLDPYIHFDKAFEVTATSDGLVVTNIVTEKGKQSYTLAVHEPAPAATPVPLTWDAATPNTATLTNGMPAGNVTVSVEYFPQAEFATRAGETPELLAPTAIPDVPANTDAPIVKAGTIANIGTSEVPQGTLMYFVSQPTGNTDPDAPTYDTKGWTDKVPTADGLAQGKAFVWYYIKGAEPANIADRTDDNTRSDSDIKPLGTDGIVTLAAEPTYYVSLNKTGMAEGEPAKWSAKSTNVTTAVNLGTNDLEGVKKGETVTVTYSGSKKVLGVKAEKKSSTPTLKDALADGATVVITYTWWSTNVTTFTFTNNTGTFTGNVTGIEDEYFSKNMSQNGTTLKFTASNLDLPEANVSIDFFTDTNEYFVASKGSYFTSFTISVNGTDITSQLTEVK